MNETFIIAAIVLTVIIAIGSGLWWGSRGGHGRDVLTEFSGYLITGLILIAGIALGLGALYGIVRIIGIAWKG